MKTNISVIMNLIQEEEMNLNNAMYTIKGYAINEKRLEAVEDAFAKLDVAYNNVGIQVPVATIDEASGDDFDKCIAVNLKGMWNSLKYEDKIE